jgi:GT2 family glycosyltransferase
VELEKKTFKLAVSLVLYKHKYPQLEGLIQSVQACGDGIQLTLIDNSPNSNLQAELPQNLELNYQFIGQNLGYGKAHNLSIEKSLVNANYHLVLNPDIRFEPTAILQMITYLDANPNIGLLMPKVLYPNGEIQHLCKLMPTPFDLIMRRFIPNFLHPWFKHRMEQYELKHKDYNKTMEVPNLSGCFMLMRCEALKFTGLFDDRFFMYLEDTDLSRRMNQQFQTVYYPEVSIIHHYEKGSYKSNKLLLYHISSAFKYFWKYGWFFDTVRTTVNKLSLR